MAKTYNLLVLLDEFLSDVNQRAGLARISQFTLLRDVLGDDEAARRVKRELPKWKRNSIRLLMNPLTAPGKIYRAIGAEARERAGLDADTSMG